MSYTPTEWKKGDIVSSSKLNKLEQGIANVGGVTIVNIDGTSADEPRLDMTARDLYEACSRGPVFTFGQSPDGTAITHELITGASIFAEQYNFFTNAASYSATSADAYPVDAGGK